LRKGVFITFEGIDGSGKNTQIDLLARHLGGLGCDVVVTREPGGSALGERIREVLLDPALSPGAEAEFLLFAIEHVKSIIEPALSRGAVVLCNRFADSSVAYQGYGGGLDSEFIDGVNERVTRGIVPDLTFLLDVEPRSNFVDARGGGRDRIERRGQEYLARVRRGYLELARAFPERVKTVKADLTVPEVQRIVRALTIPFLKEKGVAIEGG